MQFDERVHLVSVGGGFLRTPFLTSTQNPSLNLQPGECPVVAPQIIHLPAAGRKNGLNLPSPAFRRAILTSSLCRLVTRDGAAQLNQEASGVTFGFSPKPDRNMAWARLGQFKSFGADTLVLDDIGNATGRPADVTVIPPSQMTTGFLAFISRFWQDLRHIDAQIMTEAIIPLQFECDFDIVPMASGSFRAYLPIMGNQGSVIVFDPDVGPSSYTPGDGVSFGDYGRANVLSDGAGGWILEIEVSAMSLDVFRIAIADDSGQVFSRSLMIKDAFPAGSIIRLPHAMVGVPYLASLMEQDIVQRIFGKDCPSDMTTDVFGMTLPAGLEISRGPHEIIIYGTPTEYGTNFGIIPQAIPQEGLKHFGISLTVNRPPRELMAIVDVERADLSTGEFYSVQFMPFGSTLCYGGHAFQFRRFRSNSEPWPGVVEIPYQYDSANPTSARDRERMWRET